MAWDLSGNIKGPPGASGLAHSDGLMLGNAGTKYQVVSCILRNTGSGFTILDDASHTPIGVSGVVTQSETALVVDFNFTATNAVSAVATPDETLGRIGYTAGISLGLSSLTVYVAQPGGISDYIYYGGSPAAWRSLKGVINFSAFNTTSGAIDLTHQDVGPVVGGSATSRSYTNRATLDSMGQTTTRVYLVDSSGVTAKTASTDHRFWVNRTGARIVPMTELVQTNSNLWVYALLEVA